LIPGDMVDMAFDLSRKLQFGCMAYDFIRDPVSGKALLIECCHTFPPRYILRCPGYLDSAFDWKPGSYHPADLVLEDLVQQ